jgi:ABC-type arginine transport system permease subunit
LRVCCTYENAQAAKKKRQEKNSCGRHGFGTASSTLTDGLASLTSRIFLCLSLTSRGAKISKKVKEVDAIYINACFIRGCSSTLIIQFIYFSPQTSQNKVST